MHDNDFKFLRGVICFNICFDVNVCILNQVLVWVWFLVIFGAKIRWQFQGPDGQGQIKVKKRVNYLKLIIANGLFAKSVVFAYCKTLSPEKE